MEVHQKHFSTKIQFNFGERELAYKIRDNSGEREMQVDYGRIPKQCRKVFDRNQWLRNAGLIWCVLGLAFTAWAALEDRVTLGSAFWLFVGLACLAVYRLTWSEYTVFDTADGSIFVMAGPQHDAVIAQIETRRKSVLLQWFRDLDFNGDPAGRAQAIEWMKKQGALSAQEAEVLIRDPAWSAAPKLIGPDAPPDRKLH